ncbi:hypothetical protein BDV96DRAFT_648176 [Lophiotrema nucula]|uniref:Uncharacterized protein n=1 Tax=Lophiotrema nucula TaxID=690887 RepID=A0A6A5Z192_9PLEO|nr:hypothetical protein BDV96DRAFT_648176 [Lophiotrema nucula]
MDITDAIDRRLPYRVGYPTLPTLPVETEYAPCTKYFTNVAEWGRDLPVMLDKLGIDAALVDTRYRYHKECKKDDEVTLVILSKYDEDCQPKWIQAIKDIHAYFYQRNILIGIIELVDIRVWYRPPMPKPILLQEEETLRAITEIQPLLSREIAAYSWVTVDALHWYSPARGDHHPTFVITARDTSNSAWWTTTIPAIRNIIADAHADLDVVLLYLDNLSIQSHVTEDETNDGRQPPDASMLECFYDSPIPMGSSCGLRGSRDSGTWGCRVLLEKDGSQLDLGLTNCHVLLRDFARDNKGPFRPGSLPEDFTVMSPSDRDHEVAKQKLEERVTVATTKLQDFNNVFGQLQGTTWIGRLIGQLLGGFLREEELSPSDKIRQKTLIKQLEICMENLTAARKKDREVGTIFAASGYTTMPLDSSSSNTTKDVPQNKPQDAPKDTPKDTPENGWALDWCLFNLDRQARMREKTGKRMTWAHVDPLENYKVIKRGRSTGLTKGLICAAKPLIHNFGDALPEPDPGKSSIVEEEEIKDTFVKKKKGIDDTSDKTSIYSHSVISTSKANCGHFELPGDSGSVVMLDDENSTRVALGLIHAGNPAALVTYMIPMEILIMSIEDVTGGKVVCLLDW